MFQVEISFINFIFHFHISVHENDPFLTGARGSVMKVPLPRVLTVHTPGPVDLTQDRRAQDPVQVLTNVTSGFHGQEAEVDPQLIHHEIQF